ncbi:dienelactone hydrolase family protein [Halobellus sp. Atlit-38R]|uniref:dienelactone hydrolase family protein n=1 Tax=Halobellus sp. Atlit-38R TaxID=2282131 RepID=UPI001314707E|nr:dienelactone hydrolase family protein [Halobellus sp. Atlit-38R]
MDFPDSNRHLAGVLLAVTLIGSIGWATPFVLWSDAGDSGYTVEQVYVRADDRITTATLYLPDGNERVPGVVFGAGSGTAPALYTNYGTALAMNGFAVLIAGQTRELEADRPIHWEIRRERSVLFERATRDYTNWVSYLGSHSRVEEGRLVLAGHSGGANSAYRVAYEQPDVDGVVAIAGRFPPARAEPFPTNLLLATGSEDSLVPPSTLTNVSVELTGTAVHPGERTGAFENGTATRVVVAEGATHLSESDNPRLVHATTDWALRSVGKSPPSNLGVRVRSIGSVLYQFLFGLVGVLTGTALTKQVVASQFDEQWRRETTVSFVWLAGFATVLHTTLSQRVYHLGPAPTQLTKYVLLATLLLVVGVALDRTASLTSWSNTSVGSSLFDLAFLFVPAGMFVVVSTQFVTFQLVTTIVLSSVALAVLTVFLGELAVLNVQRRSRWAAIGTAVLWVVPAIVPPYL